MSKEKQSKGVWDEPVPPEIARTISTDSSAENSDAGNSQPEFNPAFNSSVLEVKREQPSPIKHQTPKDNIQHSQFLPKQSKPSLEESKEQKFTEPTPTKDIVSHTTVSDTTGTNTQPIPELAKKPLFGNMDKFKKPKIVRASIKSVFPHIILCITCVLLGLFPSVVISFLGDDLQQMPETIIENMPTIIGVFFILIAVFILVIMGKQLATGSLWLYDGHIKFKKGLLESETHYYGNLQTVEAERSLSSMWSDTGDLVLLHPKGSLTMRNVLHPFQVRDDIRDQIKHHKNN